MQTPNLQKTDTIIGHVVGPKGNPGDTGMYAFEIRADGNLYCIYDTATPPAFSINSEGDLIYTIGGL